MTSNVEVVQVNGHIGAEIRGVDLAQPLDERSFETVQAALVRH